MVYGPRFTLFEPRRGVLGHRFTPHERQVTTRDPEFMPHEPAPMSDHQISLSKFHTMRLHDLAHCMPLPIPADSIAGLLARPELILEFDVVTGHRAVPLERKGTRMNAVTRRKLDMGDRALNFSRAHPDSSTGYQAALTALEQRLARAKQLADVQQQGIDKRKAANHRKAELRQQMRKGQLRHLARVARLASRETTELDGKLVLHSKPKSYRSFRGLAGTMLAEAQTDKDLLVKYGLAESVLESLIQSLAEFDRMVTESTEAFRAHVAASAELDVLGEEVVDYVGVMDTLNRVRFAKVPAVLEEWDAVSNIIGHTPTTDEPQPPQTGIERPAA